MNTTLMLMDYYQLKAKIKNWHDKLYWKIDEVNTAISQLEDLKADLQNIDTELEQLIKLPEQVNNA